MRPTARPPASVPPSYPLYFLLHPTYAAVLRARLATESLLDAPRPALLDERVASAEPH